MLLFVFFKFSNLSVCCMNLNFALTSVFCTVSKTKREEKWPCWTIFQGEGNTGVKHVCILNCRHCPGDGRGPSGIQASFGHSVYVVVPFDRPCLDQRVHPCMPADDYSRSSDRLLLQQVSPALSPGMCLCVWAVYASLKIFGSFHSTLGKRVTRIRKANQQKDGAKIRPESSFMVQKKQSVLNLMHFQALLLKLEM